jgi:uncharacterized membrane protein (DUF2068 family)
MTDRGIFLIAIFKLVKALLLLLVAIGALSLLDDHIRISTEFHIGQLTSDPHYRYLQKFASILGFASKHEVAMVSLGSIFYAALFATEGIGLLMQKRWAEYFTSIVTASFLPLEIYEIVHRPDILKVSILAINIAVLVYLILRLKH